MGMDKWIFFRIAAYFVAAFLFLAWSDFYIGNKVSISLICAFTWGMLNEIITQLKRR